MDWSAPSKWYLVNSYIETFFCQCRILKHVSFDHVCLWLSMRYDVIKWKHFLLCGEFAGRRWMRGIRRSSVNSPHTGLWRGALMFSLICALTNCSGNNRDTGDWRRHSAHYDVTVMERSGIERRFTTMNIYWLTLIRRMSLVRLQTAN